MKGLLRLLVVGVLMPCAVFAQSIPTATITGKVSADKAALPGVTVTAQSQNLQGTRTAVTSSAGDYILPLLPPGDYSVSFELEGMQRITKKVTLTVARTDRIDVELRPAAVAESITVTADTPMTAAIESTSVSTNFKQSLMENLPVQRDLRSITLLAPGVNNNGPQYVAGGNITIAGAMSYDSLFLVNGAIVNENLRGQPHQLFIEDAIQETTVVPAGISAEYGHFTGGVVNMITKSGGNDLKGSFRTTFNNQSWSYKTPLTAAQTSKTNPVYEATLGGPFLRDRIWFFGAGRYAKVDDILQTQPGLGRAGDQDANGNPIPAGAPIAPITYPHGTKESRGEAKLTGTITPKHSVVASYIKVAASETNQTGQVIMDLRSLVPARQTPISLMALNYNGALSSRVFIEGQFSEKKYSFLHSGSRWYDNIDGTLITDRARGTRFWSPTFRATDKGEHRNHTLYTGKGTYFWSTPRVGSHEIKGGYEHFLEVRNVNNYQNGSDYRVSVSQSIVRGDQIFGRFTGGANGTATRISYLPILVLSEGSQYKSDSVYLNDRWTLNGHWTFNLGARYDKNDAMSGAHTFQIAKDSAISPRVAAHYDLFGNGRLIANVSYGQYVGRLSEGIGNKADPAGRNASFQWNYRGPSINDNVNAPTSSLIPTDKALQMIFDWFFANGGTNLRPFRTPPSVPGVQSNLDQNGLTSPNVKEYTVGLGGALGSRGYARADAVWRNWDDFYTSFVDLSTGRVSDAYGTTYDRAIIRNDSSLYDRRYYGLLTQFGYRLFQHLNLGGTYTWSRLIGNVVGENAGSGPLLGAAGEYPEYREAKWNRPTGYLPGEDQRHRARLWASYDVPSRAGDFNFSILQNYDSGTPADVVGSIDPSSYVRNPGYLTVPTAVDYYFGGRAVLRTDSISRTDLAMIYKRKFMGIEVYVHPEILNVFNGQGTVGFDTQVLTALDTGSGLKPFNPFTDAPVECSQGASAATCTSMNANFQRGPNFGKPAQESDYQTPRTYRFSVGVRF